MHASWVGCLGLLGACYQPEFVKDTNASSTDSGSDTADAEDTTTACITAFPATGADALNSDAPRVGALSTTPASVADDCADFGGTCTPSDWISHDAAVCIGPHEGVGPGVDDQVYAALRFDSAVGAVVWAVENDQGLRSDGTEAWGLGVLLDATTGAVVLGPYEWRQVVGG